MARKLYYTVRTRVAQAGGQWHREKQETIPQAEQIVPRARIHEELELFLSMARLVEQVNSSVFYHRATRTLKTILQTLSPRDHFSIRGDTFTNWQVNFPRSKSLGPR